ncbi:MAG TPA: hypothetical protein DE060_00460 [Lentisphaeria bacterium]|nr:hypothetical protein [Lentisphaeria bacterium]HCG47660.1 hypothetical protein [Lentisphaeria bacterium]
MAFRKSRVTIHVKSVTFLHAGKIFILFSIPRPYGSALRRKELSKLRFPSGSGGTAAGGISPAATNLCSWLAAGQRPAPYDFRLSSFQYPAASGKTVHFPACIFPLECYIMCICTQYKETIMARTKKCRRVCCRPACRRFQAESAEHSVELLLDELEAMRLVDLEQMEQGKASVRMGISRGTIQRLLYSGRGKVVSALVSGMNIVIPDGDFEPPPEDCSLHKPACRRCCRSNDPNQTHKTGERKMIIAATCENEEIFQHFGHTPSFAIFEIQDGLISGMQIVPTGDSGHGALAGFLKERNVDILLCGGIGGGAQAALAEHGIKVVGGVSGNVIKAIGEYLAGELKTNPDFKCSHHHHDHEHGESCHGHQNGCKCHN